MKETWTIEGETREELIEQAVSTALGMSLMYSVEIGWRTDGSKTAYVSNAAVDTGVIQCATETEAAELARAIWTQLQAELAEMPPFDGRQPIRARWLPLVDG